MRYALHGAFSISVGSIECIDPSSRISTSEDDLRGDPTGAFRDLDPEVVAQPGHGHCNHPHW